jgi:phosphatidylglycerol:prolipoprotein diacylglycerol transferase
MYPVLLQFGNFELRSYGVVVALSFLIGLWLSTREAKRKGLDPGLVQDFAPYALLGGILGARIYFILFSNPGYYLINPWEILAIWHGGIGVIGSLIGGFLVALWYCRRNHVPLLMFGDTLAPGIALGQTLGQFACLLNGDSYGRPTGLPWAITYTDPRSLAPLNIPLHPIEIYEMVNYFLVFLLVWQTRRKYRTDGLAFFTYLAAYGVARFSVEFFRGNPAIFAWGIPAAQIFGVALILIALLGLLRLRDCVAMSF